MWSGGSSKIARTAEVLLRVQVGLFGSGSAGLGDKISPTLRRDAETMLAKLYRDGRRQAELALRGYGENDAAEVLPQSCPYSLDDICREDWYPDGLGGKP